ncbi:DUF5134 domain-containing protein [Nocardia sp. CDC159]|uniref:DUF5134 domain-containing protein n=1 Tax=Nocardia pulmonis TaxID=2951408 RepID=A0A9X2E5M6_9NOCA|nr:MULTISPECIES: DUF5134 domain-containing protein [Nocardia]MCM6774259.1 DUF5134 domain-containing protein [Nocardia pulmonis]MCM6787146.1 DUF5134 domain-containing protein [Nocardia sp. CDC159]
MAGFVLEYGWLRWAAVIAFAVAGTIVAGRVIAGSVTGDGGQRVSPAIDYESDAAHLLMCLVMGVMLIFPAAASPQALDGVLTAMVVVYAALLVERITQWRKSSGMAIAYHLVAAAAMLYAMSAHMTPGRHAPVLVALAAVFALDAVVTLLPARLSLWHRIAHPSGPVGPIARIPHVVMDLGTAYMMIAALG